jgi:hypothetical protein
VKKNRFIKAACLLFLPAATAADPRDLMSEHTRAVYDHLAAIPKDNRPSGQFSFAPGTPIEVAIAFQELLYPGIDQEFALVSRWPGGDQGDPIHLTYSFVPDGTTVPTVANEPEAPSSLIANLNLRFTEESTWRGLFSQCFGRWADLSGVSYEEVSDDGAPLFDSPGSESRGEIRICGKFLDGSGGILAFNNFPGTDFKTLGGGDMILDTTDSALWPNPAGDFLFFRNLVTHEHGHGLGMLHVCPVEETKLMEPFISTIYDGPQLDDIRAVQRHYGDPGEPNDSPASATALLAITGAQSNADRSIDDTSDMDMFAMYLPAGSTVSAVLTPIGFTYESAFFLTGCFDIETVQAARAADLRLRLLDTDGTTPLFTAALGGLGQSEVMPPQAAPAHGVYYLEITGDPWSDVQLYELGMVFNIAASTPYDFDGDGDVDLVDFGQFQICFTGPNGTATLACTPADGDNDGDVDLVDFGEFQIVFTGPG